MKSTIFWDITPHSPLKVNRRFGGTNLLAACFHAGFLLILFFYPEDGGDTFLRNVCWLSTHYTALHPRSWYSSQRWLWSVLSFGMWRRVVWYSINLPTFRRYVLLTPFAAGCMLLGLLFLFSPSFLQFPLPILIPPISPYSLIILLLTLYGASLNNKRNTVWSSGQSFWLQIQRSRVRFQALPYFLRGSGSGTGSTQPREDNWGATWKEK
jgi:hypothetical protein